VDCHGVLHEKRQRNLPLELLIIDRLKFNCTTDGLYPDPNKDCYIYHSCLNGIHEIEYCQYPLIFNPEKSKCDSIQNVQFSANCPPNTHSFWIQRRKDSDMNEPGLKNTVNF
ncbi:unnamed protein product, partial [Didymodactylos carnosus]